jgi:hypothetical protein
MSKMIETAELRHRDLFEMPNGSVYVTEGHGSAESPFKARLWCAHPPDLNTAHPLLIDLPLESVRLLTSQHESGVHTRHEGYVKQVFVAEMNRRHGDQMRGVYAKMSHEAEETRRQERSRRPWWKKLFR